MELKFNSAYGLSCQLDLQCGRTITMTAIHQDMTYSGLLEGTPNASANDDDVASALRDAQKLCILAGKAHLITPPRRDYRIRPGDMEWIIELDHGWIPEWLPMVRCIGSFKSLGAASDGPGDLSCLVIVWFQDEFALPITEPALQQILSLDWDALATSYDLY